jgi:hypothetical protein
VRYLVVILDPRLCTTSTNCLLHPGDDVTNFFQCGLGTSGATRPRTLIDNVQQGKCSVSACFDTDIWQLGKQINNYSKSSLSFILPMSERVLFCD